MGWSGGVELRERQEHAQRLAHPPRREAFHPRVQRINRNDAYPQPIIATVSQQCDPCRFCFGGGVAGGLSGGMGPGGRVVVAPLPLVTISGWSSEGSSEERRV